MSALKKILQLAAVLVFAISANCSAAPGAGEIPETEIALGWLQIGSREAQVIKIYGAPNYTTSRYDGAWGGDLKTLHYGSGFEVTLYNGGVIEVKTSANNGIKTPGGFSVGAKISDVINYYNRVGTPNTADGKIGVQSERMVRYDYKWYTNLVYEFDGLGRVTVIRILVMP